MPSVDRLDAGAVGEGNLAPKKGMYDSIYVPVDNSDHSNASVLLAVELGAAYKAKLVEMGADY